MRRGGVGTILGFTLLEVMVVLGVIALLVTLGLALTGMVQERAAAARARGELAHIAQALERYKTHFGDYPWVDPQDGGEQLLFEALTLGGGVEGRWAESNREHSARRFVDLSVLTAGVPFRSGEVAAGAKGLEGSGYVFLDPWGAPYVYLYRSSAADEWERAGYLLLSLGPSGGRSRMAGWVEAHEVPPTGILPNDYFERGGAYDNIISK